MQLRFSKRDRAGLASCGDVESSLLEFPTPEPSHVAFKRVRAYLFLANNNSTTMPAKRRTVRDLLDSDFLAFQYASNQTWKRVSDLLLATCEKLGKEYDHDLLLAALEEHVAVYEKYGIEAPPPPPGVLEEQSGAKFYRVSQNSPIVLQGRDVVAVYPDGTRGIVELPRYGVVEPQLLEWSTTVEINAKTMHKARTV